MNCLEDNDYHHQMEELVTVSNALQCVITLIFWILFLIFFHVIFVFCLFSLEIFLLYCVLYSFSFCLSFSEIFWCQFLECLILIFLLSLRFCISPEPFLVIFPGYLDNNVYIFLWFFFFIFSMQFPHQPIAPCVLFSITKKKIFLFLFFLLLITFYS